MPHFTPPPPTPDPNDPLAHLSDAQNEALSTFARLTDPDIAIPVLNELISDLSAYLTTLTQLRDRLRKSHTITHLDDFSPETPPGQANAFVREHLIALEIDELRPQLNRYRRRHRLLSLPHHVSQTERDFESSLEAVRAHTNLLALAKDLVDPALSPTRRQARCPFHDDQSPSFTVYQDHYHCFGCQAHGDAIDLVMRLTDRSFPDAVAYLADHYLA